MYNAFYELQREPFHVTPDPEFLFPSPAHKEALAAIIYGIEQRKGFVAITGEVGVGKTTILRSYLDFADRENLKLIYVYNSNLSFDELVTMLLQELGVEERPPSTFQAVTLLHEALIEVYRKNRTVVLIIDEAQNMPVETLESLRMLSNLETVTEKLIQIMLIGQPEFDELLQQHRLRQLRQRIAIHARIGALNLEDSLAYLEHRLAKVALGTKPVFTKNALRMIAEASEGIPRTLNILSDNALITGYGYQVRPVNAKIVKEVLADRGFVPGVGAGAAAAEPKREKSRAGLWAAAGLAAAAAIALIVTVLALQPNLLRRNEPQLARIEPTLGERAAPPAAPRDVATAQPSRDATPPPPESARSQPQPASPREASPPAPPAPPRAAGNPPVERPQLLDRRPVVTPPPVAVTEPPRERPPTRQAPAAEPAPAPALAIPPAPPPRPTEIARAPSPPAPPAPAPSAPREVEATPAPAPRPALAAPPAAPVARPTPPGPVAAAPTVAPPASPPAAPAPAPAPAAEPPVARSGSIDTAALAPRPPAPAPAPSAPPATAPRRAQGPIPLAPPARTATPPAAPRPAPSIAAAPTPAPAPPPIPSVMMPSASGSGVAAPPSVEVASAGTIAQPLPAPPPPSTQTVKAVRAGDSLWTMAEEVYGFVSPTILRRLQDANPQIRNINVLAPGQEVVFPRVQESPFDRGTVLSEGVSGSGRN